MLIKIEVPSSRLSLGLTILNSLKLFFIKHNTEVDVRNQKSKINNQNVIEFQKL